MKIKTATLTGAQLDWAVAKCEDRTILQYLGGGILVNGRTKLGAELEVAQGFNYMWHPSTDWAQGGTIIERESLGIGQTWEGSEWVASTHDQDAPVIYGPTPLIAAMRCYVASKLGNEVEIPEELM